MTDLLKIADNINSKASDYKIGNLQHLRKEILSKSRLPSQFIFDHRAVSEEWAFHYGGRKELQFNIGFEGEYLRFGVAFSLELSQSLPNIDILIPKIALFNEYLSENLFKFSDLQMWHYAPDRSDDYQPKLITSDLVTKGVFIFLGKKLPLDNLDYTLILETLDRLLPIYLYIEEFSKHSDDEAYSLTDVVNSGFKFSTGCSNKPSLTTASTTEKQLNVQLIHNDIQYQLYKNLCAEFGSENVGTEINTNGLSIDVVLKIDNSYHFYEIKTATTARACIRQALGQILEYSYWPGHQQASKLIIVGTTKIQPDELTYLDFLRNTFNLPLHYQEIAT